jgi:hypothetical protein
MGVVCDKLSLKTAEEDMTVYKILTIDDKSVFFKKQYVKGENVNEDEEDMRYDEKAKYYFQGKGWLNSHKTEEDAIKFRDRVLPKGIGMKIVEMTIPKGESYYEDYLGTIASKKLIYETL